MAISLFQWWNSQFNKVTRPVITFIHASSFFLYIHLGTICLEGPPGNFPVSRWASPPLVRRNEWRTCSGSESVAPSTEYEYSLRTTS